MTRSARAGSDMVDGLTGTDGHRHPHEDGRSLAGRRFDLERGAHERRTLLHSHQAVSTPRLVVVAVSLREPDAVVFDNQEDAVRPPFENDFDAPGASMLGDVVERLLSNPIQ